MSTTRKLAMPIFGTIAGIAGIAIAILPATTLADSPWDGPDPTPTYVADSPWDGPALGTSDDSPWD
jgi:hypothetical protein